MIIIDLRLPNIGVGDQQFRKLLQYCITSNKGAADYWALSAHVRASKRRHDHH